jgi:hypothetical protein
MLEMEYRLAESTKHPEPSPRAFLAGSHGYLGFT